MLRIWMACIVCVTIAWPAGGGEKASRTYLLRGTAGELPSETGDDSTKMSKVKSEELGGTAIEIQLLDTFGQSKARVADWTSSTTLHLDIVNKGGKQLELEFNLFHSGTKDFATRVVAPFTLKPGKNEVRIAVKDLKNTNGTAAKLAEVRRWYVASETPVTLHVGDIWLEGKGSGTPASKIKTDFTYKTKTDPVSAQPGGTEIDPEPRIAYTYGPNMRFGVSVLKDQAGKPTNKLLTFAANGRTSTTVVRIDGQDQEFGAAAGKWVDKEAIIPSDASRQSRDGSKSTWEAGGVRVKQIVEIVAGKQPVEVSPGVSKRLYDTCLVRYVIENPDTKPHKVGLRFQLDTLIGANDGVPFMVPGLPGLEKTQRDFRTAKEVPDFIQALENPDLQNPGTIAHLTLKVGGTLEAPGRVSLTRWPKTQSFAWDIPMRDMEDDSAVVMYWSEREIQPGEKRTLGIAYGLGAVASGEGGKLALTVSGAFEVGQEFSVTAYVQNPVKGETLTLNLPDGLVRSQGKEKEPVPPLASGSGDGNSIVTWKVKAQRAGEFLLKARSSRKLEAVKAVIISSPAIPTMTEASGKVIFLLVQNNGEKFGPADDALDTEVVFRIDSEPDRLFGFTLRDDANARSHQAMVEILRAAFTAQGVVHLNYEIVNAKTSGTVTRLWIERDRALTKPDDRK